MSASKQALERELRRVQKRLAQVKETMEANPLGRIIEIRREFAEIIKQHGATSPITAKRADQLAAEEKRMFALSERQLSPKLREERSKLERAERELAWDIGLLEVHEGRRYNKTERLACTSHG